MNGEQFPPVTIRKFSSQQIIMPPNYPQPGFPVKQFPPQGSPQVQSGGSTGRVFGCAAIGCGSIVLMAIVACGVGYWGLFYSSYPLKMLESSIEESGDVEIEGMTGNISTGVEIEKLRFRENPNEENWSELNGVEVKYRSVGSMLNKSGFVVEKINIDSARFMVHLDEDFEVSSDLDFTEFVREIASAGDGEFDFDMQRGEIEVKQVWLKNIVLADPDNGRELRIDEVRFDGMRVVDGELKHLGDVTVRADLLEIDSSPSDKYPDRPINRKFDVRLKKEATPVLVQDLPLQVDFGYRNAKQTTASVSAFGGQILFEPPDGGEQIYLKFAKFTPADFLDAGRFGIMPSEVQLSLVRNQGKNKDWKLESGSHSFVLGQTGFNVEQAGDKEMEYVAEGTVQGKTVTARLSLTGQLPLLRVRLESDEEWSDQDLWGRTVYDKPFSELDEERQKMVVRTLDAIKKSSAVKSESPEIPAIPKLPELPPENTIPDEDGGESGAESSGGTG